MRNLVPVHACHSATCNAGPAVLTRGSRKGCAKTVSEVFVEVSGVFSPERQCAINIVLSLCHDTLDTIVNGLGGSHGKSLASCHTDSVLSSPPSFLGPSGPVSCKVCGIFVAQNAGQLTMRKG